MTLAALQLATIMKYPDSPGFKEKGGTSEQAAREIASDAKAMRDQVLCYLRQCGPSMPEEIADKLNIDLLNVRPRLSELKTAGKIIKSGIKRRNDRGKLVIVWAAREELQQGELI